MAVMSLLLAAEAAGLGALFFGLFEHEADVRALLRIPDDWQPLGTVALGWPRCPRPPAQPVGGGASPTEAGGAALPGCLAFVPEQVTQAAGQKIELGGAGLVGGGALTEGVLDPVPLVVAVDPRGRGRHRRALRASRPRAARAPGLRGAGPAARSP